MAGQRRPPLLALTALLVLCAAAGAVQHPNIETLRELFYDSFSLDLVAPRAAVQEPLSRLVPGSQDLPAPTARCDQVPISVDPAAGFGDSTRCAPSFVIAGVMKGGTTSLYRYLFQHPQVYGVLDQAGRIDAHNSHIVSRKIATPTVTGDKETRFFMPGIFGKTRSKCDQDEHLVMQLYYDLFPVVSPWTDEEPMDSEARGILGEGTPMYISQSGVASQIRKVLPNMKVIMVLRDPVERIYSEYQHRRTLESKGKGFGEPGHFHYCVLVDYTIASYCVSDMWKKVDNGVSAEAQATRRSEFQHVQQCTKTLEQDLANLKKQLDPKVNSTVEDFCSGSSSAWCKEPYMHKLVKVSVRNFMTACKTIPGTRNGLYDLQLLEWLRVFPLDQMLILFSRDLYSDAPAVLARVERFLGISHYEEWAAVTKKVFNILPGKGTLLALEQEKTQATAYPPMRNTTRAFLRAFYEPSARRLGALLNCTVPW